VEGLKQGERGCREVTHFFENPRPLAENARRTGNPGGYFTNKLQPTDQQLPFVNQLRRKVGVQQDE
jgi:hypothetical protein